MPKREYTLKRYCSHPGCKEWSPVSYSRYKDYTEGYQRQQKNPWKCLKHGNLNKVLNVDNTALFENFIVKEDTLWKRNVFMNIRTQKAETGTTTSIIGPGFRIFAEDLPIGTKVQLSASIILPETTNNNGKE